MSGSLHVFDEDSIKRISKGIRWVEDQMRGRLFSIESDDHQFDFVYVKITDEIDTDVIGYYPGQIHYWDVNDEEWKLSGSPGEYVQVISNNQKTLTVDSIYFGILLGKKEDDPENRIYVLVGDFPTGGSSGGLSEVWFARLIGMIDGKYSWIERVFIYSDGEINGSRFGINNARPLFDIPGLTIATGTNDNGPLVRMWQDGDGDGYIFDLLAGRTWLGKITAVDENNYYSWQEKTWFGGAAGFPSEQDGPRSGTNNARFRPPWRYANSVNPPIGDNLVGAICWFWFNKNAAYEYARIEFTPIDRYRIESIINATYPSTANSFTIMPSKTPPLVQQNLYGVLGEWKDATEAGVSGFGITLAPNSLGPTVWSGLGSTLQQKEFGPFVVYDSGASTPGQKAVPPTGPSYPSLRWQLINGRRYWQILDPRVAHGRTYDSSWITLGTGDRSGNLAQFSSVGDIGNDVEFNVGTVSIPAPMRIYIITDDNLPEDPFINVTNLNLTPGYDYLIMLKVTVSASFRLPNAANMSLVQPYGRLTIVKLAGEDVTVMVYTSTNYDGSIQDFIGTASPDTHTSLQMDKNADHVELWPVPSTDPVYSWPTAAWVVISRGPTREIADQAIENATYTIQQGTF